MRDYITHVGGFLVIGGLVAGCYALDAWYAKRIRREVARRDALEAQREFNRRIDRLIRTAFCQHSPVAIELHGDVTAEEAAEYLIWDSGCSLPRVVED